ncbi:glycosyltransferase 87 family protein [Streptomyces sp. NPDC058284]|uniref:glycosyltransferase 87 family protein n=1 Tax=unclassified Streptomyces TaxID=2593676 RepID=UPI0036631193
MRRLHPTDPVTDKAGSRAWTVGAGALVLAVAGFGIHLACRLTERAYRWHQRDATVYFDATRHLFDGGPGLYGTPYGASRLPFTYPPFSALVFRVLGSVGWQSFRVLLPALTLFALGAALHRMARTLPPSATWPPARRLALVLAVTAVCLWLTPVYLTFQAGQINLFLLALVVWDFSLPTGSRWKGVGVGLAAGLKVTPAIFIVYLLLTRRGRAAATAVATTAATVAVGALFLPGASLHYWTALGDLSSEATGRGRINLAATHNQSLNGLILRTLGDAPFPHALWVLAVCLTAVAGLACAAAVSRRGHDLWGMVLCATTAVLVSPLSWAHHWVWVAPALLLLVARGAAAPRRATAGGLYAAAAALWCWYAAWPVPLPEDPPKLSPAGIIALPTGPLPGSLAHVWAFTHENAYVVTGLLAITVTGVRVLARAVQERGRLVSPEDSYAPH